MSFWPWQLAILPPLLLLFPSNFFLAQYPFPRHPPPPLFSSHLSSLEVSAGASFQTSAYIIHRHQIWGILSTLLRNVPEQVRHHYGFFVPVDQMTSKQQAWFVIVVVGSHDMNSRCGGENKLGDKMFDYVIL